MLSMSFPSSLKYLSTVLLLVLLVATSAAAQTGEDALRFGQRDPGGSARMVGLAGAGVAGVADWGATLANPAGLALVRRSHVTSSLEVSSVGNETQTGDRFTTRSGRFGAGHAAYIYRLPTLRGSFVLGGGYHQTAVLDRTLYFDVPTAGGARVGEIYERGWLGELSGVVALEAAPRIYVGGAVNVPLGSYTFEQYGSSVNQPFLRTDVRGVNFRGGVIAEAVPGIRLGLAVETPTWFHLTEGPREGGFHPSYPDHVTYSVQTPWRMAAGAAYDLGRVLVTGDIGFADWSQARLRPTHVYSDANRAVVREFRETLDLRLGAEYDFALGAVRGGYAFAQDPLREQVEANRTRHTFGAGLSYYAAPGITLDLGLSLTEFQDQHFPAGATEPVRESVGTFRALAGLQVNI
jgi:opacity protein-like surface antigen